MIQYTMKKLAFAINGRGGAGKDTMINYASDYFKIRNVSSVDKLKELARIGGWKDEDKQTAKGRQLLVDLKELFVKFNDLPQVYLLEQFSEFMKSDQEFMFAHIREPKEIKKFNKATGGKSLLIIRPDLKTTFDIANEKNITELQYDYTFENTGTIEESGQRFVQLLKDIQMGL